MKFFISALALSFVAVAVAHKGDYEEEDMNMGFCLDHETTGALCLAGSTLADKMPAAFENCFGDEESTRKRGKGGKGGKRGKGGKKGKEGKSNECPSFDDIIEYLEDKFMDDGCVLKELGWIDEDGNEIRDVIDADLATLNSGVQSGLSEEGIEQCVEDMLAETEEKYADCADKYSEEESATLEEIAVKIVSYKCFMMNFKDACFNHIQADYVEPLVQSLYATK